MFKMHSHKSFREDEQIRLYEWSLNEDTYFGHCISMYEIGSRKALKALKKESIYGFITATVNGSLVFCRNF